MSLGLDPRAVGPPVQQAAGAFSQISCYCFACNNIKIQQSYPNIQVDYSFDQIDPVFAANLAKAQAHASQWTGDIHQTSVESECTGGMFGIVDVTMFVSPIFDTLLQIENAIPAGGSATPDQRQQIQGNLSQLLQYVGLVTEGLTDSDSALTTFNGLLVQDYQSLVAGTASIDNAKKKMQAMINSEIQKNAGYGAIEQTWADIGEDLGNSLDLLSTQIDTLAGANETAQRTVSDILTQWSGLQTLVSAATDDLKNAQGDEKARLQKLDIETSKNEWQDVAEIVVKAFHTA
jgi:hypothetical protein